MCGDIDVDVDTDTDTKSCGILTVYATKQIRKTETQCMHITNCNVISVFFYIDYEGNFFFFFTFDSDLIKMINSYNI